MPHLDTAQDLAQYLRTQEVPATEVREGDILIGQGRVVLVSRIKRIEYGPSCFLEFEAEPCPRDPDEYIRCIALKPTDGAIIVERGALRA